MLLGRERELQAVDALLAGARGGTSGVLAFVGEAGIGKSSLLEAAAARAAGMQVLRATGIQSEAQIPFAGLFELLRPALARVDTLPRPQAAAIESALALRPARAYERFAVGAATLSLLAAHAEAAPLAVLVDDAHWLDGSTADALRFALRRLVADPIVVLLTVRAGEPSLLDGSDLPTFAVDGLDPEASAELIRRQAPETSAAAAERLHRETGGNPLALIELARERLPELPLESPAPVLTTVAARYVDRVRALPARTRASLLLAAAAELRELAVLARAGLDPADLVPAEEQGLVAVEAGRIRFLHPVIRSAVYGDAGPDERRAAHRALADALPDSEADRRAWHLALAATGLDDRASSALEQAAVRARERSAYDVASHAYERAALLTPDDRRRALLELAAADAAWLSGDATRATALAESAATGAADEETALEIERLRGHIALRRGPLETGRAIMLAAAEQTAASAPDTAIVMLAEAAEGAFFAGDAAGMLACGERCAALSATGERATFFALMTVGMGRVVAGADERGAESIREAVALLERTVDLARDERLLAWAAFGPLWLREAGVGEELVARAVAVARERSAAGTLPHLLAHVGIGEAASDRLLEARATFDEAIRLARETGQRTILCFSLARLALVEARCGRGEESRAYAEEALELARSLGAHLFEVWSLSSLGELELARGDATAALARFEELLQTTERHGISDPDLSPAPELTELYLRLGRADDAVATVAAFAPAAASKGQPWARARAARAGALLVSDDDIAPAFDEALTLHARTPDVFETARTELAYGARLRRAGKRIRSREQLRAALRRFEDLGATPWAELARAELAATGETARRRDSSTLDELTAQELKVSLLLADGKTTREAAAALFLSPKTVEYHLRNAYRKLGVRSRGELAAALAPDREV